MDEYLGSGEYSKYVDITSFIIDEETTTSDVDRLISFVKRVGNLKEIENPRVVIDVVSDYKEIVNKLGGQVIKIDSTASKATFNPFEVEPLKKENS